MTRLLVHVEGETEENFVNEVLRHYLVERGYQRVDARIVGNARLRSRRGGIRPWPAVRREIIRHLSQDVGCYATTLVDYYALPALGDEGWPGRLSASSAPHHEKGAIIAEAISHDVRREAGDALARRFIPFIVMHEFEALLFSDCDAFANEIGRPALAARFQTIRNQFETPEHINDSPQTAPSKRVEGLVPGYQKPLHGTLAALGVGIDRIRINCPHFSEWIERLEAIPTNVEPV